MPTAKTLPPPGQERFVICFAILVNEFAYYHCLEGVDWEMVDKPSKADWWPTYRRAANFAKNIDTFKVSKLPPYVIAAVGG